MALSRTTITTLAMASSDMGVVGPGERKAYEIQIPQPSPPTRRVFNGYNALPNLDPANVLDITPSKRHHPT